VTKGAPEAATTVLVVEDEESFVEALTIGLKREGFRVEVAPEPVQALQRFDAVHPDLVLLDVLHAGQGGDRSRGGAPRMARPAPSPTWTRQ
jgi:CheY-like chemotaxis protein